MEENLLSPLISDGIVRDIKFSIASFEEICNYSVSDCPISHPSQLTNPFLGLPLEAGKCESCGTAENGNCEGHFGYIELPVPVYHPLHITELRDILSLVCFKCLRMKKGKIKDKGGKSNVSATSCTFCRDLPPISIKEVKTSDGAFCLELNVPARTRLRENFWNFLNRYGFRHGDGTCRVLLPVEALNILKEIPEETKRRLSAKGFFPQIGYILQYLPVPPNCLLVPEISDGKSVMSSDVSISLLKRVLSKIELIKRSRSGSPNFESHEVECNDLQLAITEYFHLRGTTKAPHDIMRKFVLGPEASKNSSKQWLEKMRTLFISKGSGFSSRSVITGDAYIGINEIGLPSEIAKKVTFEERVTDHNLARLQKMVDNRLCVTYKDGKSTYAIAVGSKGHTNLKVGQIINRSIVDGDIVFINRPPSTHKHSLQAFSVFIHNDHTVKINPLVCAPLGADFDGDCVHIFYPQSLAAKAEVMELFSVEQQLLSSHSGQLNFQLVNDALLTLKVMANKSFLRKETAQQLAMFVSQVLPPPAVFRARNFGSLWTVHQILQCALPPFIDYFGQRHVINKSEILKFEFNRDFLQSSLTDIITSILAAKGPKDALNFFNSLQPLLMEVLSLEGFSVSLKDFNVPNARLREVRESIQKISTLLPKVRISYDERLELKVERDLARLKEPITAFILQSSSLGFLIDSKSESSINKVLQQIGSLGLQLFDKGKLYSRALVEDVYSHFVKKISSGDCSPSSEAYGLVKSSLFHGLNPFEKFVHSISSREVIIRSSRGLTEPGVLFKNLMAILRDVVVSYDGTVRNVCSNSLIQFEYELDDGAKPFSVSPAGEPVGVLAATAISTPAYKAVLDSTHSTTNSSWEQMKEILLSKGSYQNKLVDRRIILFLNDCSCGKKFCRVNAAFTVRSCLRSVALRHCATEFSIEYQKEIITPNGSGIASGLMGHIHLDKTKLESWNQNAEGILRKCQEVVLSQRKKKGLSHILKRTSLSASECCSSHQSDDGNFSGLPCLQFSYCAEGFDETLEQGIHVMTNTICPILLDTVVKGDPRIDTVNFMWPESDATSWVRNPRRNLKSELALEVVVKKNTAQKNGDAWGIVLDACLPVIHLIDTTRSIPYAIQQVKELLGISCAFDQSVQRLAKCIRKVSKGVIKEHLVLVGNSMTCTGNLIGFNTAGFKALFKSLKVQVPLTEATLFTPMKCFEKSAEKCHTDSLGSIVSSVSWGKHVAVGTGTNFDIIWGQKDQVACNKDVGKDVYNLLAWVREPRERDLTGAGIGSDIEDFIDDYQNEDMPVSPNAYEKPTFDDYIEADGRDNTDSLQGWDNKAKPATNIGNTSSWDKGSVEAATSGADVWSGWDQSQSNKSRNDSFTNHEEHKQSIWSANKPEAGNSSWAPKKPEVENNNSWIQGKGNASSWASKKPEVENNSWSQGKGTESSWAPKKAEVENNSWNQSRGNESSWAPKENKDKQVEDSSAWGNIAKRNEPREFDSSSGWVKNTQAYKNPQDDNSGWNTNTQVNKNMQDDSFSGWNSNTLANKNLQDGGSSGWNKNTRANKNLQDDSSTGSNKNPQDDSSLGWNSNSQANKDPQDGSSFGWSKKTQAMKNPQDGSSAGWNKNLGAQTQDSAWGENKGNDTKIIESSSGWNKNSETKALEGNPSEWPPKKTQDQSSSGWQKNVEDNENNAWSAKKPMVDNSLAWTPSENKENPWAVARTPEAGSSLGGDGENGKKGWTKSQGWGSSSFNERRGGPRNNSPRPPLGGRPDNRKGWKQAEAFTTEEEKILIDLEPVMNLIRKTLREASDGDRLSPENQKFIVENVFEYHPDKEAKVVGKIDYIMVDKHSNFTETRCFYVVSTDGSRADFSYIKCMENFVKVTYPEHAESFNSKFFKKRRAPELGNEGQQTPKEN